MKSLVLVFLVVSCSSLKPHYDFCKETDWRERGMSDAKDDQDVDEKIREYQLMCRSFDDDNMKPDLTMYRFGHSTGVKQLCTPVKGFERGAKGFNISKNCSLKSHPKFFSEMKKGLKQYCSKGTGYNFAMDGKVVSPVCNEKEHRPFYIGVRKGMQNYCTYQYGLRVGTLDQDYNGICKGKAEEAFLRGHAKGKTESAVKRLRAEVKSLQLKNTKLTERYRAARSENSRLKQELNRSQSREEKLLKQLTEEKKKGTRIY